MGLVWLYLLAAGIIIVVATLILIARSVRSPRKTFAIALARGLPTEPKEMGLDAIEQEFTFPDGTTSPGWIVEGEQKDGPVVVISHGWRDSRYGSLLRVPFFTPFASRVVIYDLRGMGDNSAKACKLGTIEGHDLLAVIEQVAQADERVVLFGSSLGAGVSIVAGSLAGRKGRDRNEQASQRLAKIVGVIAEGAYRHFLEPIIGYLRLYKIYPYPIVWLFWAHMSFWHGKLGEYDRCAHAAALDCPLLVLHGDCDPISRFESAVAISEAADDCSLVVFDKAGHTDLAWYDGKLYQESLEAFFTKIAEGDQTESSDTVDAGI